MIGGIALGGTFLKVLGPSNGSDDTTWLNTALAAGGSLRGKPGETYLISDPLVLRSRTILDMRGCTVRTIGTGAVHAPSARPLTGNMVVNYAAVNPTAVAQGARTTPGTNVVTTTLVPTVGQTVVMSGAGGASGGVVVPLVATVTAVGTGTITINKTTVADPAYQISAYTRDKGVRILGGKWDRGSWGGVGQGIDGHSFLFRHVDGLSVDLEEFVSTDGAYAVSAADVTDYELAIRWISSRLDGIHIMGPATNGRVPYIAGSTGDDSVSVTAGDYAGLTTDCAGDVIGLEIGTINTTATQSNLKLIAGMNHTIDGVVVTGVIQGTSATYPVWIGDDTGNLGTVGGTYGSIDVGTILSKPTVPGSHAQMFLSAPNASTIRGRFRYGATGGYVAATGLGGSGSAAGASTAVIERLLLDCDVTGPGGIFNAAGTATTIAKLVVDGKYKQFSGSGAALVLAGKISELDVRAQVTLTGSLASGLLRLTGSNPVDVSLLTPNDGDLALNSNAALACGIGRVVFNAAAAKWKNLYTGLTT